MYTVGQQMQPVALNQATLAQLATPSSLYHTIYEDAKGVERVIQTRYTRSLIAASALFLSGLALSRKNMRVGGYLLGAIGFGLLWQNANPRCTVLETNPPILKCS